MAIGIVCKGIQRVVMGYTAPEPQVADMQKPAAAAGLRERTLDPPPTGYLVLAALRAPAHPKVGNMNFAELQVTVGTVLLVEGVD